MRSLVTASLRRSLPRSAKPSMAELSCDGTSIGEITSSRQHAAQRVADRPPFHRLTTGTSRAMNSCACGTGSAFGS